MFEPSAPGSRRDAFETIALGHFDTVYNVAMAFTRNPDEAQDLVQETYEKAYPFWHRFQPGTPVKAWLLTIVRHTHIRASRRASRHRIHRTVEPVAPLDGDVSCTPEWTDPASIDAMLRHVVQDEVKQAIDALPETYRLPVLLADLAECSYQEIAAIVGCPLGTVMSRLVRGRKLLRTHLHVFARASGYIRSGPPRDAGTSDLERATEPHRPLQCSVASKELCELGG